MINETMNMLNISLNVLYTNASHVAFFHAPNSHRCVTLEIAMHGIAQPYSMHRFAKYTHSSCN